MENIKSLIIEDLNRIDKILNSLFENENEVFFFIKKIFV